MRGKRITYRPEELAFVRALSSLPRVLITAELHAVFGRTDVTVDHIKALCSRHGWGTRAHFTPEEDAVIRAQYPDLPTATVAAHLGRTTASVYRRASALGISKSAAFLASAMSGRTRGGVGVATRFQKGMTPANKGKKRGRGWAPGRMRETQFRAGSTPHTWMPVGSTRIISGYEYTKVSDVRNVAYTVNWKETHRLKWEAVHGPIPKGHALKCLDGNPLHTDPTNWVCVPRAVLPRLNGGPRKQRLAFDDAPAEIKPVLLTLAQLQHAAKQRRARA